MTSTASAASTALLVVDLQQEFIGEGALFRVPGGERIVEQSRAVIATAREQGATIFYTAFAVPDAQPVGRSTLRFGETRAHRYPGAALVDGLDVRERDIIIEKPRQSAFVGTSLELLLRRSGLDRVVILGVTTHSCCLATAIDAAALDFDVVVLSDLTASPAVRPNGNLPGMTPEEAHLAALQLIGYSSGRVMTSDDLLREISGG